MKPKWVLLIAIITIPICVSIAPFWVLMPLSFIIGLLLDKHHSVGYLFLFIFFFFLLFFGVQAFMADSQNEGLMANRIAGVTKLPAGIIPLVTAIVMSLPIAVFSWSGALFRRVISKSTKHSA